MTSRDSKTDIVRGFDAGADDYMTKPFNDNELRARTRVAERLVRTQSSLSESVAELREVLNQLEMLEGGVEVCRACQKIFNKYDGHWHSFDELLKNDNDPQFVLNTCPMLYWQIIRGKVFLTTAAFSITCPRKTSLPGRAWNRL